MPSPSERRPRTRGGSWIRQSRRHAIYHRDEDTCCWCGRCLEPEEKSLDHLVPGSHASHLLVTCCRPCNRYRGARRVGDWLRHLRDVRGSDMGEVMARLGRRHRPLSRGHGKLRYALQRHGVPAEAPAERPWFDEGGVLY